MDASRILILQRLHEYNELAQINKSHCYPPAQSHYEGVHAWSSIHEMSKPFRTATILIHPETHIYRSLHTPFIHSTRIIWWGYNNSGDRRSNSDVWAIKALRIASVFCWLCNLGHIWPTSYAHKIQYTLWEQQKAIRTFIISLYKRIKKNKKTKGCQCKHPLYPPTLYTVTSVVSIFQSKNINIFLSLCPILMSCAGGYVYSNKALHTFQVPVTEHTDILHWQIETF